MSEEKTVSYCKCELPIRVTRKAQDRYKTAYCAACDCEVDPNSKMINKLIERLNLKVPTRNEAIIQDKVNEIIDLLRASGMML